LLSGQTGEVYHVARTFNGSVLRAMKSARNGFDATAFFEAIDAQRIQRGLSWRQVADQIWEQSAALNRQRQDHPISPSTLTGIARRGDCTCQHALFFLRWLGRTPESAFSLRHLRRTEPHCPQQGRIVDCDGILLRCTGR